MLKKYGFDPQYLDQFPDDLFKDLTGKDGSGLRNFAKSLTIQRQKGYMDGKLGMIIDKTGHNFKKIKRHKKDLEKEGYDTYMIFVNTTLEVAQTRNKKRERVLPENVVEKMWKDVQKNLGGFQSLFKNNFVIVDNSDTLDADKAAKKFGAYVRSHADKWATSPIKNPIGKQWVKDQVKLKNAGVK
jgi:predicted kinase